MRCRTQHPRSRGGARIVFAIIFACIAAPPVVPGARAADATDVRMLDDFAQAARWKAVASDGVTASIHGATGPGGPALRMDFDLAGTAGYAIARRALPIELPANYEISFYVRADAPVNDLQFKLIDASGDNVWWFHRRNFEFPRDWQRVRIKKRQIDFAWGPGKDHRLQRAATLEFVVAAGRGGGKGSVYFSQLELRPLPPDPTVWPAPVVRATSSLPGAGPALALDGNGATAWKSDPAAGAEQRITVDFKAAREFGGLVLRWLGDAHAVRYDVQLSDDGEKWRTVRTIAAGHGGVDALRIPDAEARFLRLALHAGPESGYGLAELEIKEPSFGESDNAFFLAVAREFPRGTFPRGFSGEQPWWTIVGVDGGSETALLSEDGALEVARGGFSIEPFVVTDAGVATWADADARPFLIDRYLPMPGVTWHLPECELRVTTFATGTRANSQVLARYDVHNRTDHNVTITLALAIRPFQVNPPAQFLNAPGGVSAIHDLAWDGTALSVNGARRVFPLSAPDGARTFSFEAGALPGLLATPEKSGARQVHDPTGYASGILEYRLALAPGETSTAGLVVPLSGAAAAPKLSGLSVPKWLARQQSAVAAGWRAKLDRVSIRVPESGQPIVDTLRTALAHILITRDGPILRPGTRSYARSWIRDGAMMSEALLRLGHPEVATAYLRWYATHQFANGKVPCCVDERGADPVPENDSPGEFLFLAATIYRHTGNQALLAELWPHLDAAARYLEGLRQSERTPANLEPGRRAFYGLLPASISHEGYSEKPVHSYWDDFWALKGYDAAVEIATVLGHGAAADRIGQERDQFRHDLASSISETIAAHAIAYLPGSAELGDFDPTSSTIALAPDGDRQALPAAAVTSTYERYWREFVDRRDGRMAWSEYTPYELRNVGAFVRLGWRDRAQELLAFFLAGRRPPAWNQWPEVVGREIRQPRFVGDVPHGWVASDFICAALDLLAYDRSRDGSIVLAGGIPAEWLKGPGIEVKGLQTRYGRLSYSARQDGARIEVRIGSDSRLPPGGFVLAWPLGESPGETLVNGKRVDWNDNELRIHELPAEVVIATR